MFGAEILFYYFLPWNYECKVLEAQTPQTSTVQNCIPEPSYTLLKPFQVNSRLTFVILCGQNTSATSAIFNITLTSVSVF